MNEVKKSLDAMATFSSEDMEDVKQGVLSGKRRQKRRNPFPAAITALVAAAVLFFSFNMLQEGFSTADEDDYEINEIIYHFMLRNESVGNGVDATDEMKQAVLQNILLVDALNDYAKTIGYSEDMEAIDKMVADQRDAFYADLENEDEERKNIILQGREDTLGMTIENYFDVLMKWTARAQKANDWLIQHPQENPITHGEVVGLFENKYGRSIADFMEQKAIPPFALTAKYVEHTGTVAAIEGDKVLITHGFEEDAPSKKEKLIINGAASRFIINDATDEIALGMDIRVVYDSLASPVTSHGTSLIYEKVTEWERIGSNTESEYLATNEKELSNADIETAYEMSVVALTDYYKAVWNGTDIDLDAFIENENLKQYMQQKVQSQHDVYGHLDGKVKNIEISDAWEAEFTDDADGGFLYLHLPAAITKYHGGGYGEGTEFLIRNVDGKLVIVDWYTGGKDTYDFIVRGENETIDDPDIWNDEEWVKKFVGMNN